MKQINVYSKAETDSQIQKKTSGYQSGKGRNAQDSSMGLRDTNYYI